VIAGIEAVQMIRKRASAGDYQEEPTRQAWVFGSLLGLNYHRNRNPLATPLYDSTLLQHFPDKG
jgi:hypothetical protein